MLSKLVRHDVKALSHFLPVLYAVCLLITLLIRFNMVRLIMFQTLGISVLFLYIIFLILIIGAAELFIGIHFYRSLFSDEGYLTHTLPVTGSQLLLSKTIAGSIWIGISITLSLISGCIVMSAPFIGEFFSVTSGDMLILLFTLILQGITDVIIVNASVAIGQLFTHRPILGAVITYLAISTAGSVLESVCSQLLGLDPLKPAFSITVGAGQDTGTFVYSAGELMVSIALAIATAAVLYLVTHHILKKKINLV